MNRMTGKPRKQRINDIMVQHASATESLGTAIRCLRLEVSGFDQETFAAMCSMSTRALYLIESDKGSPTLATVDSILRKFGLWLGLMSASTAQNAKPAGPAQTTPGVQAVRTSRAAQNPLGTDVTRGAKPRLATAKNVLGAKPTRSGSKAEKALSARRMQPLNQAKTALRLTCSLLSGVKRSSLITCHTSLQPCCDGETIK